jgi:hypothetical protein
LTTHAAETTGAAQRGAGLTLLRYLDLVVLALALAVFALADLPLLGYAAAAAAWLVQRGIQAITTAKADASDDPRTIVGLIAASMIGRGWLVAGSIFAVGLAAEREDGLAAAVLSIVLFTVYFSAHMVVRPLDHAARKQA